MTISSTTRKAGPYTGNGVTTQFAFAFKVFQASDLYVVRLNTSTLVETVLVLNTDYTVSLNANQNSSPGGTITMVTAPTSTQKLTITSNIGNLQPTDLTNQGGFYPTVINDALDRATIQIQQLSDDVDRSLTIPFSTSGVTTQIPYPVAGTLLGWNSGGTSISNYTISDILTVAGSSGFSTQAFSGTGSQTVFTLSAQPGAIANLEVFVSGVRQRPSTDYTLSSTTLTFASAPGAGTNNILARWGTTLGIGVPSDTSVTPAKLSTGGLYWDTSGNVGVGTNSPASKVDVRVASGSVVSNVQSNGTSGTATDVATSNTAVSGPNSCLVANVAYGSGLAYTYSTASQYYIGTASAAPLILYTNGVEKMRIDASGNVTLGGTAISKFTVNGEMALGAVTQRAFYYYYASPTNYSYTTTASDGSFVWTSGTSSPAERMRLQADSGNLLVGYTVSNGSYRLQVNSQIFATSATIATSDGRYKENVESLSGALDIVNALRPVSFSWKQHPVHAFDTSTPTVGFIAQEVEQVLADKPWVNAIIKRNECELAPEQKDEEGNITKPAVKEEFLGIAEGNLIAILTKAVQELSARVAALEART